MKASGPILPEATVGMLGGGQLGRMFTVAARTLGFRVVVLDPDPHSPAGRIANQHLQASYDDRAALEALAQQCAVVTTEFENIPADSMAYLATRVPLRPTAAALALTQDRIEEKRFIERAGLTAAPFYPIHDRNDLQAAWEHIGAPAILKRARLGYDGKGQLSIDAAADLEEGFRKLGEVPCVLERRLQLDLEVSVVVARNLRGETSCYPVAENRHRNGILHTSIVPARIAPALAEQAQSHARTLAAALDYCGVMAVEFFVVDGRLLVNEIAPRPHNSGHYTLDACVTSQFEQQVRMVCDLPFGEPRLLSPVVMVNLLGDLWGQHAPDWLSLFAEPSAKLHLYGKREARPGRKMGHFCVLAPSADAALAQAERLYAELAR